MSIGRICRREVHLADREESAHAAAQRMRDRRVGTLVVCDGDGVPVGIVSDRDLCERVLAEGRDGRKTRVEEVMSSDLATVTEATPIEEVLRYMRAVGVRRMPVVDEGGALVGVVSVDDILALLAEELGRIGELVEGQEPVKTVPATNRPRSR